MLLGSLEKSGYGCRCPAFVQRDGTVEDVLQNLECGEISLNGHKVIKKKRPICDGSNYLVRIGSAGPEGFLQYGWDTCYFGALMDKG